MTTNTEATQRTRDYQRVERAMHFLHDHFREQPDLDDIAGAAHLSPFHFQRLFTRWAGISPNQFMRFLTVESAKRALERSESVLDATFDVGLSGPGRLHDLFVTYEGVTPGEYKAMGVGLEIAYGFHNGPFGAFLVATTERGICALEFVGERGRETALEAVRQRWPGARFVRRQKETEAVAAEVFDPTRFDSDRPLKLWFKGTNFQIRVWDALLRVPPGALTTYGAIAEAIGMPTAARAVGNAVGANPIGYLIPCHRVIRATAMADTNYRWGPARKLALIGWEAAQAEDARTAA